MPTRPEPKALDHENLKALLDALRSRQHQRVEANPFSTWLLANDGIEKDPEYPLSGLARDRLEEAFKELLTAHGLGSVHDLVRMSPRSRVSLLEQLWPRVEAEGREEARALLILYLHYMRGIPFTEIDDAWSEAKRPLKRCQDDALQIGLPLLASALHELSRGRRLTTSPDHQRVRTKVVVRVLGGWYISNEVVAELLNPRQVGEVGIIHTLPETKYLTQPRPPDKSNKFGLGFELEQLGPDGTVLAALGAKELAHDDPKLMAIRFHLHEVGDIVRYRYSLTFRDEVLAFPRGRPVFTLEATGRTHGDVDSATLIFINETRERLTAEFAVAPARAADGLLPEADFQSMPSILTTTGTVPSVALARERNFAGTLRLQIIAARADKSTSSSPPAKRIART